MAGEKNQYLNSGVVPSEPFKGTEVDVNLFPVTSRFNIPITDPVPTGSNPNSGTFNPLVQSQQNAQKLRGSIQNLSALAPDPMKYGKIFSYGADYSHQNFERYYQHPKFDKLGFSPWRDNESVYNTNSSWISDMARAMGQFPSLVATGFKSAISSWGDILTGQPTRPDLKSAQEFDKVMSVGMSTRGGVGGFTTNLFLNSGYTFGIMGELITEELLMTALAPVTGGSSLVAGGARATSAFSKLGHFTQGIKGTWQAFKGIQEAGAARQFWEASKSLGKAVMPFDRTGAYLSGLAKADNLLDYARRNSAFGSFYRDVRDINFALAEGKLEGGMVQLETDRTLTEEFYKKNGRMPNDKEAQAIAETSHSAAYATTIANLPTIYYTNRITFDALFRGFQPLGKISDDIVDAAGNKIRFSKRAAADAKDPFSVVDRSLRTTITTAPRIFSKSGMNYFRANLAEGLQETSQEVISGAAKDYYTNLYRDPSKSGADHIMASVYSNMGKQFSAQGFDTFASGFLMGGLVQPITRLPKWATVSYSKYFKPDQYNEYKKKKAEYTGNLVTTLNSLYKDPLKYFAPDIVNLATQANNAKASQEAMERGDQKSFQDLKDASVYQHIYTALRTGTYDVFLDRLRGVREMDPETLKEAFQIEDPEKVSSTIDQVVSRAEGIKNRYNLLKTKFPNPFDPKRYKGGTPEYNSEAISWSAFETARNNAVFMGHSFDRTVERMKSITEDLISNKPLEKVSSTDFGMMLDPGGLLTELSTLEQEIKAFKDSTTAEGKKLLKDKQKKLSSLSAFAEALDHYRSTLTNEEILKQLKKEDLPESISPEFLREEQVKDQEEALRKLDKAYKTHLNYLAKVSDSFKFNEKIDDSFVKLRDFYELNQDAHNLSEAVNLLHDPKGFSEHVSRTTEWMRQMYDNKEETILKGQEEMNKVRETNALINRLMDKGIVFDAESLEQYQKSGVMPEEFYDTVNRIPVMRGTDKYEEVADIIKDHEKAVSEEPIKEETPEDITPAEEPEETIVTPEEEEEELLRLKPRDTSKMPTDLLQRLKEAHTVESVRREREGDPSIGFESWVKVSVKAGQIIEDYERRKAKITPKPEAVATEEIPRPPVAPEAPEVLMTVPITSLVPTEPEQEKDLSLVEDITEAILKGETIPPIKVRKAGDKYEIIDGHHRYLAYQQAQVDNVPVRILLPEELTQYTKVHRLLEKARTQKDLDDVENKLAEMISTGEVDIPASELDQMLTQARNQLVRNITIKDIKKGDILLLKDPSMRKVKVTSRSNTEIQVRRLGQETGAVRIIPADKIKEQVELKYEPGMKPELISKPPTAQETEIARQNMELQKKSEGDVERTKRILDENKNRSQKDIDDEFDNSLGCKK